ncbi:MAG: hypothetical protein KDD60_08760 [Bdellovibrionales bacterium]|nr:hypothetical protein [Bdellovibrionales bacterium]
MTSVRLEEFALVSDIPAPVMFNLLLSNSLPFSVDEEGYICILLDKSAISVIGNQCVAAARDFLEDRSTLLSASFERLLLDYFDEIVTEARQRLTQGKHPELSHDSE